MAKPSHTKSKHRKFNRSRKASLITEANYKKRITQRKKQKIKRKQEYHIQISENSNFIRNLSDYKLSIPEITALSRGLKFIPTPKCPNIKHLMKDTNDYIRRMRIKFIMRHKQSITHPFKMKSNWVPQPTQNKRPENYFETAKLPMSEIQINTTKPNITQAEKMPLKDCQTTIILQ